MSRRTWTFPELYEAAQMVESGKTWVEVAAHLKCNESTLRATMRLHGVKYNISKRPPRKHPQADLVRAAIRIRNTEHLSWGLIAERVGWPLQPRSLQKACARHAEAHGWNITKGMPSARRTKWGTVSVKA